MSEVAKIASGLSEEERDDLLNGKCGVPRNRAEWTSECICDRNARGLLETGLAEMRSTFPGGIVRTPLGLAVRAHLLENHDARD